MADPTSLTLRLDGLFPLTHEELDDNFVFLDNKVQTGLLDGNTLKWNTADSKWEQNTLLFVDTSNQRVGIGVGGSPSVSLDVAGDIQCSGVIDGGSF